MARLALARDAGSDPGGERREEESTEVENRNFGISPTCIFPISISVLKIISLLQFPRNEAVSGDERAPEAPEGKDRAGEDEANEKGDNIFFIYSPQI